MHNFRYIATIDERGKPMVIKVRVVGEQNQWRQLHIVGESYKGEPTIIVHARHIHEEWICAWTKAKQISRFRAKTRGTGKLPPDAKGAMWRVKPIGQTGNVATEAGKKKSANAQECRMQEAETGVASRTPVTARRDAHYNFPPRSSERGAGVNVKSFEHPQRGDAQKCTTPKKPVETADWIEAVTRGRDRE